MCFCCVKLTAQVSCVRLLCLVWPPSIGPDQNTAVRGVEKKKNVASEHNPPSIPLIFRKQGCPTLQHTGIRAATRSCKNFKQIVDGAETAPGNIKYWRAILFSLHCKSAHLASLFSCTTAYNEN